MRYDVMTHKTQQSLNTFFNPLLGGSDLPTGTNKLMSPDASPQDCTGGFYNQQQQKMLAAYKALPRGVCDSVMSKLLDLSEDEVKVLRGVLVKNNHVCEVGVIIDRTTNLKVKSWGVTQ